MPTDRKKYFQIYYERHKEKLRAYNLDYYYRITKVKRINETPEEAQIRKFVRREKQRQRYNKDEEYREKRKAETRKRYHRKSST